ncbi:MAG: TIGR02466 family protein [Sphingomonadaceae bacterium]
MARLSSIFATPLIVERLDDADLDEALERAILERRDTQRGIRRSNIGGWHSDTAILDWGGPPARALGRKVIALANRHTADRKGGRIEHDWLIEGWANVSERGAANTVHTHPAAFWSAVYYVRVGGGEGGKLILLDPRLPALTMQAPDLLFHGTGAQRQVALQPAAGMLVMFPAWLNHMVSPWEGGGPRISVAFNLSGRHRPRPGLMPASRIPE